MLDGVSLLPVGEARFEGPSDQVLEFDGPALGAERPHAHLMSQTLDRARLEPVGTVEPSVDRLSEYVGEYWSEDAEVSYWIELHEGRLRSRQRYDVFIDLTPVYEDAFTGFGATFIFDRDPAGLVSGFTMARDRVWGLDFERR